MRQARLAIKSETTRFSEGRPIGAKEKRQDRATGLVIPKSGAVRSHASIRPRVRMSRSASLASIRSQSSRNGYIACRAEE